MISFDNIKLTEGYIARHTPTGSGTPGREAAIIDIAQDLLLSYLEDAGKMNEISIKGGTAIRKLYAGKEGRFSLDLDFSINNELSDPKDISSAFIGEIDGLILGPFRYSVSERRNKWYIGLESQFNETEILKTKLDFAPYPWLEPIKKTFAELPIQKQYGFTLPAINTVRLEENIAEKIARLNRTSTARDMYDLNWIMENVSISNTIDKDLLKRMVVLKIWVDSYGMHYGNIYWHPAHEPSVFDPEKWLYNRNHKEVDAEDIGTLAIPTPTPEELIEHLKINYAFLLDLDDEEMIIAQSNQRDRGKVIKMLSELPGSRLKGTLY